MTARRGVVSLMKQLIDVALHLLRDANACIRYGELKPLPIAGVFDVQLDGALASEADGIAEEVG